MAPKKVRFLKVEISYREGQRLNEWNSSELGSTEMVQEIADPRSSQLGAPLAALSSAIQRAAAELVQRTEELTPSDEPEAAS